MNKIVDFNNEEEVMAVANKLTEHANKYTEHRSEAGRMKFKLDLIIASKMPRLREYRNNIGYETARIMILERDYYDTDEQHKEVLEYHQKASYHEAQYKGLEKLIDALQSQISLTQSLIKNRLQHS